MSKSSPKTSREKQRKSQKLDVATERLNDTGWPSGAPFSPARWKFMASFYLQSKVANVHTVTEGHKQVRNRRLFEMGPSGG